MITYGYAHDRYATSMVALLPCWPYIVFRGNWYPTSRWRSIELDSSLLLMHNVDIDMKMTFASIDCNDLICQCPTKGLNKKLTKQNNSELLSIGKQQCLTIVVPTQLEDSWYPHLLCSYHSSTFPKGFSFKVSLCFKFILINSLALLDYGETTCFIDTTFARKHKMLVVRI